MRRIACMLIGLVLALGMYAQDKKVTIKDISVSSSQNGENAEYAIDGKTNTIWHSAWNGTKFPVTVTITFAEVSHVDYLRYIPRQDGNSNGNWNNVTVSYAGQQTAVLFRRL